MKQIFLLLMLSTVSILSFSQQTDKKVRCKGISGPPGPLPCLTMVTPPAEYCNLHDSDPDTYSKATKAVAVKNKQVAVAPKKKSKNVK